MAKTPATFAVQQPLVWPRFWRRRKPVTPPVVRVPEPVTVPAPEVTLRALRYTERPTKEHPCDDLSEQPEVRWARDPKTRYAARSWCGWGALNGVRLVRYEERGALTAPFHEARVEDVQVVIVPGASS